jgi:ADP-heptose:LPS heptosyltransferase
MLLPATGRKRIGLNLASNGLVKSYPLKLYEALFDSLRALDLDLYFFGNKREQIDLSRTADLSDWRGRTTVPELAALLAQMDLVLGVDSFVVHLADLLGKTALVLLATTAPSYFARHRHISCLASGLDCSPCFAFADHCPRNHATCRAFEQPGIRPEVIAQTVQSLIREQP